MSNTFKASTQARGSQNNGVFVKVGIQCTALHSEYGRKNLADTYASIEILWDACKFLFSLYMNDSTDGACLTSLERLFHACIVEGKKELRKR